VDTEENPGSILRQEQIILRYSHQRKDAHRGKSRNIFQQEQQLHRKVHQERKDAFRGKSGIHPSATQVCYVASAIGVAFNKSRYF